MNRNNTNHKVDTILNCVGVHTVAAKLLTTHCAKSP